MQEFFNILFSIPAFLQEWFSWSPAFMWLIFELWILWIIYIFYKFFPKSWFFILLENFFEVIYDFFEEILWWEEKRWIKVYITLMFFIILFSNLLWLVLDFLTPIFWEWRENFIINPTSDINFNVAMALVWLVIIVIEQFKFLWFGKTIYEYFPVLWKDYIPYERWNMPAFIDWPLFLFVKTCDIVISLFLWILDIVWHLAKVVSLSFRLFWNMTSWWILLAMLVWAVSGLTMNTFGIDFPVVWPIILYIQWMLVSLIQALVFPLLIAIFIKVAKAW